MTLRRQWTWRLGAPATCGYFALINGWAGVIATAAAAWVTWRHR